MAPRIFPDNTSSEDLFHLQRKRSDNNTMSNRRPLNSSRVAEDIESLSTYSLATGTSQRPGLRNKRIEEANEFSEVSLTDVSEHLCSSTESETTEEAVTLSVSQRKVSSLLFGIVGIYGAYLYYGHVQEDLFNYRTADGASFKSVWLLQTFESLANILIGLVGRRVFGGRPNLSLRPFFTTGASQVFAKALTSLALAAGLSFPVCILAKSAKIVPVMLGQLVLGGSRYCLRDYLFAALVVAGTALLSFGSKKNKDSGSGSTPMGVLFILLSLVCDGLTAGFQKRLKRTYSATPPTTYDFLLFTNIAMGAVALVISVMSADMVKGLSFLQANPSVAHMVLKVCLCSAIGQSFIFFVVAAFDPLVCSTITTTRKMMSVLWSVVSKGHVLSSQGTMGLALAMCGLVLEVQGKVTRLGKSSSREFVSEKPAASELVGLV